MYLLKHATGAPTNSIIEFTFHYVSIKTKFNDINIIVAFVFTFHYVSIKTMKILFFIMWTKNWSTNSMWKPGVRDARVVPSIATVRVRA